MDTSRPPILIVDNRGPGLHPDLSAFAFVEFAEHLDLDAAEADPDAFRDRYAAVLIHGNQGGDDGPFEVDFVANTYSAPVGGARKPHLRFVGEGEVADELDGLGYIEVNRSRYRRSIIPFLEHYRRTGEVALRLFTGQAALGDRPRDEEIKPFTAGGAPPEGFITFDADLVEPDFDRSAYPVPLVSQGDIGAGNVDMLAALEPLEREPPDKPLYLPQHLPGRAPNAGLRLLAHLRLGAFLLGEGSRRPVVLASPEPSALAAALEDDPLFAAAFTQGTYRTRLGEPSLPSLAPMTEEEQRYVVDRLGTPTPDFGGPHDVANAWGSVSLRAAVDALRSGEVPDRLGAWTKDARRLLLSPYFWRLLSLGVLREPVRSGRDISPDSIRSAWQRWTAFLDAPVAARDAAGRKTSERPLRVFYLDDEAPAGWADAVRAAFASSEVRAEVRCYPEALDPVTVDGAVTAVLEEPVDLLLCDLRLQPNEERAFSSPDPAYLASLSGVRVIERVKRERPTLPVVVTTASSKAWTHRHVLGLGVDGYWVKEHPAEVHDPSDSVLRALDLITQAQEAVEHRQEIDFLWRLHLRLAAASLDSGFAQAHLTWPTQGDWHREKTKAVRTRLGAASERVAQAYGYVEGAASEAKRAAFSLNQPFDVALLSLFSATSEALKLLVKPSDGAMYYLRHDGAPVAYWQHGRSDPPPAAKGRINTEHLRFTDSPHTETLKLVLLDTELPERERYDLVKRFHDARKLRNGLRYTHGVVGSRESQSAASLDDLRHMAAVLFYLFRLDRLET